MVDPAAPPKLVCFDLGGVVVRLAESLAQAADLAGIRPEQYANRRLDLAPIMALLLEFETGKLDEATFFQQAATTMEIEPDVLKRTHAAWIIERYPGVTELWQQLRQIGLGLACLSNTSSPHWLIMSQPGRRFVPFDMLDHALASHEIGFHKPDPEAFKVLEQRSGLKGRDILYFDDHPANIEAARARHWHASPIDPRQDTARQMRNILTQWWPELNPG